MNAKQKPPREAHGRHVGAVDESLALRPAEAAYIKLTRALSAQLKQRRQHQQLTQVE